MVDPKAALADFAKVKYLVRVRTRIEAPKSPLIARNDLVCTLLGIAQTQTIDAAWFPESELLVGRNDLAEYLAYQNSNVGKRPAPPWPLLFGTHMARRGDRLVAWTKGLQFFGSREIYVDEVDVTTDAALRVVSNTGVSLGGGCTMKAGETMSTGDVACRIEEGTWDGAPALRFVPGRAR